MAGKAHSLGGAIKHVEQLDKDDMELLFERSFSSLEVSIFKQNVRDQSLRSLLADKEDLRAELIDVFEAEFRSASYGPAKGAIRLGVVRMMSNRVRLSEPLIEQTLRADNVIQEVGSIEPALKGVVERIRQRNKEVFRV